MKKLLFAMMVVAAMAASMKTAFAANRTIRIGCDVIHIFDEPGTNQLTLDKAVTARILVVGGGATGGNVIGGGGGGGQVIAASGVALSAGTYDAVVGAGGTPASNYTKQPGGYGKPSSFLTYTAAGGGHGGAWSDCPGGAGACGGGGCGGKAAGTGSAGGNGGKSNGNIPGGGGGADGDGDPGVSPKAGNGGRGIYSDITGENLDYGSGGGGGTGLDCTQIGLRSGPGAGDGVDRSTNNEADKNGLDGRGGGGGGGSYNPIKTAGAGGAGCVIVRYMDPDIDPNGVFSVTAAPEEFASGSVSPTYGLTTGHVTGEKISCTAASSALLTPSNRVICTGYRLYSVDATTQARTFESADTTNGYDYVHGGSWRELAWQWRREVLADVRQVTGGTITQMSENGWYAEGSTATFTAMPQEGVPFYRWLVDGVCTGEVGQTTLALDMDTPHVVSAHFSLVLHVSPTGSDETGTGASDAPFATLARAYAESVDGDTVRIKQGVLKVTSGFEIRKGLTFVGEDGAIVCATNAADVGGGDHPKRAIFYVDHPEVVLTNLTITGKVDGNKGCGHGVTLNGAGLVVGCTITNNACCQGPAGGVYLVGGGTVRNCYFAKNRSYQYSGGSINMSGASALVEDCVIESGATAAGNNADLYAGGVYMTGGTLRRCLLYKNSSSGTGTNNGKQLYASAGTVAFCTVTGNTDGNKVSAYGAVSIGGAATVTNCIFYGNACPDWLSSVATYTAIENCTGDALMSGTDNLLCDPLLFLENGEWRVRPGPGAGKGYRPVPVGETVPDLGTYVKTRNDTPDSDTLTLVTSISGAAVADTTFTWVVSNRTSGAVQNASGKGADYATRTFTCGMGTYDVTVTVSADGVGSATRTVAGLFTVSSLHVMPPAGVKDALAEAVATAANGTVIHLTNGWYEISGAIAIKKGITIVGDDGPSRVHVVATAKSGVTSRPFILSHADAVLANLELSGYTATGAAGVSRTYGAVQMSAGTITNCWLNSHYANRDVSGVIKGGAAVYMTGGLVVDCVLTNNYGERGSAVWAVGADCVVRRSQFYRNGYNGAWGGGFFVGSGAKAYSCLCAYNDAAKGGCVYVDGSASRVYNCTLVKGTNPTAGDAYGAAYGNYASQAACLVNCLGWGNPVAAPDPGFKNAEGGNFHLRSDSEAVDAATPLEWMTGDKDLDGRPRIQGRKPDLGCYERARGGLTLIVR